MIRHIDSVWSLVEAISRKAKTLRDGLEEILEARTLRGAQSIARTALWRVDQDQKDDDGDDP